MDKGLFPLQQPISPPFLFFLPLLSLLLLQAQHRPSLFVANRCPTSHPLPPYFDWVLDDKAVMNQLNWQAYGQAQDDKR